MVNGRFVGIVVGIEGMFGNVVGIGRDDIDGIWVIGILGNEGILNGMFKGMFWSRWRAATVLVGAVENEISAARRASAKQGLRAAIRVLAMDSSEDRKGSEGADDGGDGPDGQWTGGGNRRAWKRQQVLAMDSSEESKGVGRANSGGDG
ncbi:hypothetical protein RHMOL_Rhmol02G0238000 [Rhododendron molle]|uniref:Uncharacterized protein n=1 Tax=Rhododendron molle TaxID=49168 RepID=A0ACC0PUU2_RHOML|nr:hypothetical protein RHMOL_Rhmol02G0238000 [Rhododendron molle]